MFLIDLSFLITFQKAALMMTDYTDKTANCVISKRKRDKFYHNKITKKLVNKSKLLKLKTKVNYNNI